MVISSERGVLTTKWVANAWEKLYKNKEMIIRSFVKCGITNKIDGSEDDEVSIRGLEGYIMPLPEEEFHLQTSIEEEDNDVDCDAIVPDTEGDTSGGTATDEDYDDI